MSSPPSPLPESILAAATGLSADEPWPGLVSFGVKDVTYFHGRETEALELLRLIKRGTITLLFGKSGLGKTSLLNAGFFPKVLDNGLQPVFVRLDHAESAPPLGAQLQAAAAALWRQEPESTLWEFFHRQRKPDDPEPRRKPVVVLDQFEEIFTLGRESVTRRQRSADFFHQLADLVENNCPAQAQERFERDRGLLREYDFDRQDFKIIISMREEYLAYLEEARQPLRHAMPHRLRIVEMSGAQALEAITKSGGHLLDPGVAESIVRFLAGADAQSDADTAALEFLEVAPALLSLVCSELNNYRRAQRAATISRQMLSGNREQILVGFYERCFLGLNPAVRVFVEDQLLTTSGYRDSMAVEDAIQMPGVVTKDLETLVERRLLRIDRGGGTERIEITHDMLVGPCRLARDGRRLQERGGRGPVNWWGRVAEMLFTSCFALVSVIVTITNPILFLPLLAMGGLLLKSVFGQRKRWKWFLRLSFQILLLLTSLSCVVVETTRRTEIGPAVFMTLAVFYSLIALSSACTLSYLFTIRRVIFQASRTLKDRKAANRTNPK